MQQINPWSSIYGNCDFIFGFTADFLLSINKCLVGIMRVGSGRLGPLKLQPMEMLISSSGPLKHIGETKKKEKIFKASKQNTVYISWRFMQLCWCRRKGFNCNRGVWFFFHGLDNAIIFSINSERAYIQIHQFFFFFCFDSGKRKTWFWKAKA